MIAVDLATHCSDYRISHVITAGSPVALTAGALPATVQLLALENAADVVPHLDGGANPDRPNVITAQFRCDHGGVLANHDLRASYLPGAALVDASSDASVHAFLDGLGDFLTAGQASTATFLITRTYR
jgi:hypothetical protein